MTGYRPEPLDSSGIVARVRERMARHFGSNLRIVWNATAGRDGVPGRWQVQERGHRSGRWSHVWFVSGDAGEYRPLGEWVLAKLDDMDTQLVVEGPSGWARFRGLNDDQRKYRAMHRARAWQDRFYGDLLPRVARHAERKGMFVPRGALSAEQILKAPPKGRRDQDFFDLDVLRSGRGTIAAPRVFPKPERKRR